MLLLTAIAGFTLKLVGHKGLAVLLISVLFAGLIVVWFLQFLELLKSEHNVFLLIFNYVSKIFAVSAFLFMRGGYPGAEIIALIAVGLNLAYIILSLVKKSYKDAVGGLLYRVLMLW